MAEVRLVDLEIIKRFSLAVRSEYADAQDVLDALDASRRVVEEAANAKGSARSTRSGSTKRSSARSKKKSAAKRSSSGKRASTRRSTGGKR